MTWKGTDPGKWAEKKIARLTATYRRAVELTASDMTKTEANGGNLPHKTGNLLRSMLASTSSMPSAGPSGAIYSGAPVGAVTAQLTLEQKVWLGFQANYARRMNYGFVGEDSLGRSYNQSGRHFVEYARGRWSINVTNAAREAGLFQ